MDQKSVIINTDGGARGNPGHAGIGVVIKNSLGDFIFKHGSYIGETTNNVAEYKALIKALESAKDLEAESLKINMDSELIVKQMTGLYKIKQPLLIELACEVKKLLTNFTNYEFKHVRREYNKDADAMVNIAIDEYLKNR